jgi:hypothetical protein
VCHHGVEALIVEKTIDGDEKPDWPDEVRQELGAVVRNGAMTELWRTHKVEELLDVFDQRLLAVLIIKGEAVARTHYRSPEMRPRCDVDIFINIKDIREIKEILLDLSYQIITTTYKTHQFTAVALNNSGAAVAFDIHWRILNAPEFARTLDHEEAIAGSIALKGLEKGRTLNVVDSLLLACMHRSGSRFHDKNRLIWLYDIHLLISSMNDKLKLEFVAKAIHKNVQEACLDGLLAAQESLGTRISEEVIQGLRQPAKPRGWAQKFRNSNLALLLDDFKSLGDAKSRLDLLRELFIPSSEALLTRYHKVSRLWLPWLYFYHMLSGIRNRLLLR